MKITCKLLDRGEQLNTDIIIVSAFKNKKTEKEISSPKGKKLNKASIPNKSTSIHNTLGILNDHWPKEFIRTFESLRTFSAYNGEGNKIFHFYLPSGQMVVVAGLGEKEKCTAEKIRQVIAQVYKYLPLNNNHNHNSEAQVPTVAIEMDSFDILNKNLNDSKLEEKAKNKNIAEIISEALYLCSYRFDKYLLSKKLSLKNGDTGNTSSSSSNSSPLVNFFLVTNHKNKLPEMEKGQKRAQIVCEGINFSRDLINEAPNVLNSETMSQIVASDAKKNIIHRNNITLNAKKKSFATKVKNKEIGKINGRVTIKILDAKQIKKENMQLFLAVNQGSAYEPRLIHLTYKPSVITKKTKHIALVGKGLTFDSGGYSLKPSNSITNMKTDMSGAATVYSAFRNAVLLGTEHILSCFLGITDNMISSNAYLPDAIIKGRSGKTVEIISTDAEGRLVLADILDYAADFKPDIIVDVATLTGACVRALGHVTGIMGNNEPLINKLLGVAKEQDERIWPLPIFDEYRDDIKATIADLKNSGSTPGAGAQKAAAFLENFIRPELEWVHLDIAGINSVPHLHYCPKGSASGLMIRTLTEFLLS